MCIATKTFHLTPITWEVELSVVVKEHLSFLYLANFGIILLPTVGEQYIPLIQ